MNILLGITGSVAATLGPKIKRELSEIGHVDVVFTESAKRFTLPEYFGTIFDDASEWDCWNSHQSVLHIDLRRKADVLVIAPLSMNTLAKFANGICDNLLTSIYRAWDRTKPIVLAPAANTAMWEHPITMEHISIVQRHVPHLTIWQPVLKELVCGDVGVGGMTEISDIVDSVKRFFVWRYPVYHYSILKSKFIPTGKHPGAFGVARKYDHHTGVDLYCSKDAHVFAMERGVVVAVEDFTGEKAGSPWWNNTRSVLVAGATGVINYGEITENPGITVGRVVQKNEMIGFVKPVLKDSKKRSDIPYHSTSMLHIELYAHGTTKSISWGLDEDQPDNLLDPTPFLIEAVKSSVPSNWSN
jgi:phosphopantothenoylcysteine decarboxylase